MEPRLNKWSHRHHTRTIQLYSPGGANVHTHTLHWAARLFSIKIAPLMERYGPPSNTRFAEPTRVHNPNSISISSAVFEGLRIVPDRQTALLRL